MTIPFIVPVTKLDPGGNNNDLEKTLQCLLAANLTVAFQG